MPSTALQKNVISLLLCFAVSAISCLEPRPEPADEVVEPVDVTAMIAFNVVRHHKVGDNTAGGPNNTGCRLTNAEINAYMSELSSFIRKWFGPNVQVTWNSTPMIFFDDFVQVAQHNSANAMSFFTFQNRVKMLTDPPGSGTGSRWQPNKINIYFTGLIAPNDGPANGLFGAARDPTEACLDDASGLLFGSLPFFMINDLDYSDAPPDPMPMPGFTAGYFIQCHEWCHYLMRRIFWPPNNPQNANAEHVPDTTSVWLMRRGIDMETNRTDTLRQQELAWIAERLRLGLMYSKSLTELDPVCVGCPAECLTE